MAMAGVASAATTFTDLSQTSTVGTVTYTQPEAGSTIGTFTGAGIAAPGGGDIPEAGVSLTLNLTAINSYFTSNTKDVNLLVFDINTNVGLNLTTTGIRGAWNDSTWNDDRNFTISYTTLANLDSTWIGKDGNQYTTITVSHANITGDHGGLMVYSDSAKLGGFNGLGSSNNKNLTDIEVNTAYVISTSINAGWSDPGTCYKLNESLTAATQEITGVLVPEPTTATLSLLALAGLAARRRRR